MSGFDLTFKILTGFENFWNVGFCPSTFGKLSKQIKNVPNWPFGSLKVYIASLFENTKTCILGWKN